MLELQYLDQKAALLCFLDQHETLFSKALQVSVIESTLAWHLANLLSIMSLALAAHFSGSSSAQP